MDGFSGGKATVVMKQYEKTAFFGLYLLCAVLAFSTLWWPMGRDQGSFAMGGEIVAAGGRPYLDAWEQKGPASQATFALAHLMFGRNMWGIRVLDLLGLVVTAALVWRFLFKFENVLAAHSGTLLWCFAYLNLGYWCTAQPDGWAAMFLLMGLLGVMQRGPAKRGQPPPPVLACSRCVCGTGHAIQIHLCRLFGSLAFIRDVASGRGGRRTNKALCSNARRFFVGERDCCAMAHVPWCLCRISGNCLYL